MTQAKVLIIDDYPANLVALEALLDGCGTIVRASSGHEGLARLAEDEFAVVLLDVQMAVMSGFETAKRIRSSERSRSTPIIFLTAYDDEGNSAEDAYRLGAVDYLSKPVSPVILRTKVTQFIELFEKTQLIEHQCRELQLAAARDAALRAADANKDAFIATLAHELRNPLSPVMNAIEILKRTDLHASSITDARDMIERHIAQIVRLVEDLLDASRIRQNKLEIRRGPVELMSVIYQSIETCRPACDMAGHVVRIRSCSEPVFVNGDAARLAQTFSNILRNACKFMPTSGEIELTVDQDGDDAVVSIKDSGVGISREMLERVFDMFAQVSATLEQSKGGLGIGLAVVKRIVDLHGGNIEVRSDGVGLGSEFVIRLPTTRENTNRPLPTGDIHSESASANGRRILVVDDNRDAALSLGMILQFLGHKVQTAHDGVVALETAENFRPELVLLDIGLPKLNGYEVARALRQTQWGRELQLIALTGWGQDQDKEKSKSAGFDHHLVKPVDMHLLKNLLANDAMIEPAQLKSAEPV